MTDINPLLKKLSRGRHGTKAEKRAAKSFNSHLQPASGATDHSKGDFVRSDCLFEAKSTIHDSISIKLPWLVKISREALDISREPALVVQFVDANGKVRPEGSWVMISERVFKEKFGGRH